MFSKETDNKHWACVSFELLLIIFYAETGVSYNLNDVYCYFYLSMHAETRTCNLIFLNNAAL